MLTHSASLVAKKGAAGVVLAGALAAQAAVQSAVQSAGGPPSPEYVLASRIAQWLLSAGIFVAAIQMILYFGAQREAAKGAKEREKDLKETIAAVGAKFERFAEKVEHGFLQHAVEIGSIKTTNGEHDRRLDEHADRLGELERRHNTRRAEDREAEKRRR